MIRGTLRDSLSSGRGAGTADGTSLALESILLTSDGSKRKEAMTLPGFNADASLYKTGVHYRLMGALVQGGVQDSRVMPQEFGPCGPCYLEKTGACVHNCWHVVCFPTGDNCFLRPFTEPCPPSACPTPVNCLLREYECLAKNGFVFNCQSDNNGCPVGTGCACCQPCCKCCLVPNDPSCRPL